MTAVKALALIDAGYGPRLMTLSNTSVKADQKRFVAHEEKQVITTDDRDYNTLATTWHINNKHASLVQTSKDRLVHKQTREQTFFKYIKYISYNTPGIHWKGSDMVYSRERAPFMLIKYPL